MSCHQLTLRRWRPGDEAALWQLKYRTIHSINRRDYSAAQCAAWAPEDLDPVLWQQRVAGMDPFVAELNGELAGFADLQADGYIDHFFVSGSHARQGVGTRLMMCLHEEARLLGIGELTADVSKTAEPFFALHGFHVEEIRYPVRRSVMIPNALMRKKL